MHLRLLSCNENDRSELWPHISVHPESQHQRLNFGKRHRPVHLDGDLLRSDQELIRGSLISGFPALK